MTETEIPKQARKRIELERLLLENRDTELRNAREEVALKIDKLGLQAEQARHQFQKASDSYHNVYRFSTDINPKSVAQCRDTIVRWSRCKPASDIEVIFNSPGGTATDGMELFGVLRGLSQAGHKVVTGCQGRASSMAGILLQAGDHRWMDRNASLMIHEPSAITGGKIGDIEDSAVWYRMLCERITDIFVERSGGKTTREFFVEHWRRTDWWMMANEALEYGFVDEVRG